ncbi:MAG: hypothetical protein IPJ75_15020 [Ignavibacteriales bacterium]|nr:hypothetical protein [Ignavibacteriales bacterium]
MGKIKKTIYLLFTLSLTLTLQAQDSLLFFQYPGQKYVIMNEQSQWGGGGFFSTTFTTGTVSSGMVLNGLQYYYNPFFKVYMAYKDGKVYWNKDGNPVLVVDFTLPSASSFTGAIPPREGLLLTITKSPDRVILSNDEYNVTFKKDIGIQRLTYSTSWGPPFQVPTDKNC